MDLKSDLDRECAALDELMRKRVQLRSALESLERDIIGREALISYLSEKIKCG